MPKKSKTLIAQLPEPEVLDFAQILHDYQSGKIDLVCVLGPTASGKTKYAVRLARDLIRITSHEAGQDPENQCIKGVEIISADSRQVYRGMDIGTGKDIVEYEEIPYHLIDIAEAGDRYNVYRFQQDFKAAYSDIRSRGILPILCGGTGLYINAVTSAYDFSSSKPLSVSAQDSNQGDTKVDGLPRNTFFIGTLVSRETRNERIDARLDARLQEGMVDEIKTLLDRGVEAESLIAYGLEYKYVTLYILGELSYDEMREKLAIAIHQFAKRQMTWFRGMERSGACIHWVEV